MKLIELLTEIINNKIGYHVSNRYNDDSIKNYGILPRKKGVYIWKDLKYANWYKEFLLDSDMNTFMMTSSNSKNLIRHNKISIWKINIDGLKLIPDPEAKDMSHWSSKFKKNEFGEAYIFNGIIQPNRILGKIE